MGEHMSETSMNNPSALRRFTVLLVILILSSVTLAAQPAPPASGDVEKRIDAILSRMTLEEKIDYIGGVDDFFIRAYPQLGLPHLKMADGPLGIRTASPPATAMAGGIGLAASWDPALAARVGKEIGRDARARGVYFMLGPAMNIYRAPMNGRNFEYLGEDPYLAGQIAVGYIDGMQSEGVSSTAKHFMANNSDFDRHNTDSIIDERTMREIYLPAFEACVKQAHVGAVMDSYNLINGVHASQNSHQNIEILKGEWGFTGILMSDWTSVYDAVGAANGGLDLEMPSGVFMNRKNLLPAIQQGSVSVATIDDKVRRILRTAIQFGWLDRDQTDLSISRYNREGDQVALDAAREGAVLLKNDGNLLPLQKDGVKSILVVGPDAYPPVPSGGGSARVTGFEAVSVLKGISDYLGTAAQVFYNPGVPSIEDLAAATSFSSAAANGTPNLKAEYFENEELTGTPFLTRDEAHVNLGEPSRSSLPGRSLSSRWTGYYTPGAAGKYDVFVMSTGEDGGFYRVYVDGKLVLDDWRDSRELLGVARLSLDSSAHKVVLEQHGHSRWLGGRLRMGIVSQSAYVSSEAKALAAKADVVVVAVGFNPGSESEGADRTFHLPPGQDELIQEMLAANKNTVVVLSSGGGVDMNVWIDRTPALLQTWYPGQEGGKAIAEILFGDVNPSGRLPATFERHWEDNPVHDNYYPAAGTNRVEYKEGIFVGYRGYEHNGTKPLFAFGYGLSYTSFAYTNLNIKPAASTPTGSDSSDPLVEVSFDVKNTGSREGADVAQIYVGDPHSKVPMPPKELKGFARIDLKSGETKSSTVTLDRRAFSYYDVQTKKWNMPADEFEILVGRSSQDIELHSSVSPASKAQAH
jgi:beta-glucosidase